MGDEKVERFVHAVPEYAEATQLIEQLAETVIRLGLQNRFRIIWEPRKIVERQAKTNLVLRNLWAVYLVDHAPNLPVPTGLTATPRITRKAAQPTEITKGRGRQYEALGQTMTLPQWAKAVGVSPPTLKSRIDSGMSMEDAITSIALSKAS